MQTRRVTEHSGKTYDGEMLQIVTVWEESMNKEKVRKLTPFSKKHKVLIKCSGRYEFARERA